LLFKIEHDIISIINRFNLICLDTKWNSKISKFIYCLHYDSYF
jgi:hypothetical protein